MTSPLEQCHAEVPEHDGNIYGELLYLCLYLRLPYA